MPIAYSSGLSSRVQGRASTSAALPRHALLAIAAAVALSLSLASARAAAEDGGLSKPLRCAVESSVPKLPPKALCEKLGQALGRALLHVPDARKDKGDALQIMHDDVQWTLVLLRRAEVRAWTRVSSADARGQEVTFFARAVRSLLQAEPKPPARCVHLESKASRGFDLVYPWEELKPCERRVVEVPDPWWSTKG